MHLRLSHLPASTYKVVPWKNGAGSTTEFCIHPPGATVQNGFDWRMSLAQVPASGPFSSFAGYDRTIMLLRGDPMRLHHDNHGEHTLQAFVPYAFPGAWNTTGILTGTAVEDFNVMIKEGCGRACITVHRSLEITLIKQPKSPVQFIWACAGSGSVTVNNQRYSLNTHDSLLLEDGPDVLLHLTSRATILVVVSIDTR